MSSPNSIPLYHALLLHDANYPFSSTNANNVFTQFPSRSTMRCSCTTLIIHSLLQMRTMSSPNSHPALPFVASARDLRSPSVHSEQKSEPPGDNQQCATSPPFIRGGVKYSTKIAPTCV
ncbi:hypothetical protein CEXT_578801 [Caerostris extrusa]|uniref:Uncharacterized protein n=1 Tax=Caerostris extrusa TaxID=172846 RepID=A0AAV4R064_CAEEX|nr:hypothetical protein CEXT_578801 [Caerostris extrusa]